MKHSLLAVLVIGLGLAGCSKQSPEAPAAGTPPPAAAATGTKATASAEKLQADAGTETSDRAEATLEKAAAMPESGQLPGGKWKAGVHYKPIVPAQGTGVEPGQVEVLEVFWLGCSHCYALDPFLENWQKVKAPYVKFTRVPVMWGPAHRAHARLFYTLQALGKLDTLFGPTFDEIQTRGNMLIDSSDDKSLKMQLAFAKAHGITEADYTREYNGFFVNSNLQRAEDLTRRYKVEGVPNIIVNGKYQTDVGMAGGHEQLIALINDLTAFEKKR